MPEIAIQNSNYPQLLKEVFSPPKRLYYQGDITLLQRPCISIVGTRKATEYGENVVKKLLTEIKHLNICVVSGLAKGIDSFAHDYSLNFNIPTIAVLGCGLAKIYPAENKNLTARIIRQNGLILSEHPPNTPPLKAFFPQRNRIISGISLLTIVIEAPFRSGALITARFALEQGRDVAVIPGDIDRENSQGILRLLQNGAFPISCGEDIIKLLGQQTLLPKEWALKSPECPLLNTNLIKLSPEENSIISQLNNLRGKTPEEIGRKSQNNPQQILKILSYLEIKGLIKGKNGKFFLTRAGH